MAAVFISSIYGKGYTTVGQRNKVLIYCGIVSFLSLLLIIYGSLLYMGACVSGDYAQNIGRAELLVLGIIGRFMPNNGAYKGSVYLVTLFALLESLPGLSSLGFAKAIVAATPLSTYGFGWIVPFIIGLIGGSIIGHFGSASSAAPSSAISYPPQNP